MISGEEVIELLPALEQRNPSGGYLFSDCQTDDARLVRTCSARPSGSARSSPTGWRWSSCSSARGRETAGVRVRDHETGEEFDVRADNVINATGVWADRIRPDELRNEAEVPRIAPSRGTHVTIAHEQLPLVAGAIVPAGEGRTIFALPWLGRSLIGTTDNNYEGSWSTSGRPRRTSRTCCRRSTRSSGPRSAPAI